MIPLHDSIPSKRIPFVNYAIIAICSLAFLAQLADSSGRLTQSYAMVPIRFQSDNAPIIIRSQAPVQTPTGIQVQTIDREIAPAAIPPWLTMLTCMFLHGGWMHFLGNMWFLYIFGDNVEDRFGHLGFTAIYLATGVAAGLAHYWSDLQSPVPTIGASGAIAGIMGAYAWLYPRSRVTAILPLGVLTQVLVVPAPIFLGIWFAIQTFSGISAAASGQAGGVAWWAHIGGFVAGGAVALIIGREEHSRVDRKPSWY